VTTFSSCDRYTAPAARRWTAGRRLELLTTLADGKTTPDAVSKQRGIDVAELTLWCIAHVKLGIAGLKAKNLTAIAREQRRAA